MQLQENNKKLTTENVNTVLKCKKEMKEKDKNIEQLKQANENTNELLKERETSLDEALQREANNVNKTIDLDEQVKILENERAASDAHKSYLTEKLERYRNIGEQSHTTNPPS